MDDRFRRVSRCLQFVNDFFFRGQELQENEVTVEELRMFANEILDLREANEVHELDSDVDKQPVKKRKRETERGFGGTLLSVGTDERCHGSDSCEDIHDPLQVPSEKVCTVCTLLNAYDAIVCQVCDTPFV